MVIVTITYEFFNASQKMVISEMIPNEPSKIDYNNNIRSNVLDCVG